MSKKLIIVVGLAAAMLAPAVPAGAATSSLLGADTTGSSVASTTAFSGPFHQMIARVVDSSSPAVTLEYEITNQDGNYCLDANDKGSTAGQNGDKVQLFSCNGGTNQLWYTTSINSAGNATLHNGMYPSECLNANDSPSLGDGSVVQLWTCGTEANNMWNVGTWSTCLDSYAYCPLYLESDNYEYVLDAKSPGIGDGDQVQIFTYNGDDNQFWTSAN
jgi:hypothetical protein